MKLKIAKSLIALSFISVGALFVAAKPSSQLPGPEPDIDEEYKDFEYSFKNATYYHPEDEHEHAYTILELNMTNNGVGYISNFYLQNFGNYEIAFNYGTENSVFAFYSPYNDEHPIDKYDHYKTNLLGPGLSSPYYCRINDYTPEEIGTSFNIKCHAYASLADTFVLKTTKITYSRTPGFYEEHPYEYKFSIEYDLQKEEYYDYFFFYTIEYHDVAYSFQSRKEDVDYFYTSEEINIDEIVIRDVTLLKGFQRYANYDAHDRSFLSSLFLWLLFGTPFVLAGLIVTGAIAGVVVVIIFAVKRRKNEETNLHVDPPDDLNNKID